MPTSTTCPWEQEMNKRIQRLACIVESDQQPREDTVSVSQQKAIGYECKLCQMLTPAREKVRASDKKTQDGF